MDKKEILYPRIGETVVEATLPNGLKLFIVPKPKHRKKYAFFATRYGGMDMQFIQNGEKRTTPAGIAHYLEHKMFDTEDGNALQQLSQNGAEPNAFTSNAMTGYYFDCTAHFEENLRILLSFVSVPYFTEESVEKERGIIAQEIRMVEDSPDWQVYERLLACLYRSSPARVPIAGTVESIAGITAETLYDCHHAFYCPSNMALCVVGNVDPHAVIALAEEVLPRERGEEIARCYGEEEDGAAAQKETITQMEVALPQFLVGFKCETNEGDLLRQSLIGEMASDVLLGDSSPLYQRLYDEGLINSSFGGGFDQLPGVAVLCAGGESEQPQQVSDAILGEAQRLAREGIDPDFFEQIRRASFGATLRALNSFENIAISMADGYFRGFDALRFPEAYASIEKADVERFLRKNLTDSRRAISIIEPKKVFKTDDPKALIVDYKDDATAFNGEKKGQIAGKGVVNNTMTNIIFKILEEKGVPTHLIKQLSDRETLVKAVKILPLEVIMRNVSAGSFAKRYGVEEGIEFDEPTFEVSYKNDDLGDPLMCESHALALKLVTKEQLETVKKYASIVNETLKEFFLEKGLKLIDFKIEFGLYDGEVILADEISPDTCRLWDVKTGEKMDKDRFRRDLGNVEETYAEVLKRVKND